VQASALRAEVDALEAMQRDRAETQAVTLAGEVSRAREAASREAKRVGERLVMQYRQDAQAQLRAMREGAQKRYDDQMRQVSEDVRSQFNARMKTIEAEATEVHSKSARLQQAVAAASARLEAV